MTIKAKRKLFAALTAIGLISAASAVAAAGASDGPSSTRPRDRVPTADRASAPITYGVNVQAVYDKAGNPDLTGNFSPDGGVAKPIWSICPPPDVSVCTPANSKSQFLEAGPTPAGTVFQATATYNGNTYLARSALWQGTVRATTRPRLEGSARYGAPVKPHGASWAGGWGSEFDLVSVEACRTRDARRCVNLSAPEGYGFSNRPPVVGAWFTGWYLFAFDQRLPHDILFAEPGYGSAAAVPPVKAGQTVARSAP